MRQIRRADRFLSLAKTVKKFFKSIISCSVLFFAWTSRSIAFSLCLSLHPSVDVTRLKNERFEGLSSDKLLTLNIFLNGKKYIPTNPRWLEWKVRWELSKLSLIQSYQHVEIAPRGNRNQMNDGRNICLTSWLFDGAVVACCCCCCCCCSMLMTMPETVSLCMCATETSRRSRWNDVPLSLSLPSVCLGFFPSPSSSLHNVAVLFPLFYY